MRLITALQVLLLCLGVASSAAATVEREQDDQPEQEKEWPPNGPISERLAQNGSDRGATTMNQAQEMQFPLYMRILATIACVVILAVGVCGNLLVPLVVIKTKYLRNSTNLFLINLSVADLLVLIVCMPTVLIELHSRPETWLLGEPMCKLSNFVEMLAANGSIFTILAISFERYYAICKPLKAGYKCTRLRATLIICLVWLLASILTSPILIIAKSNETVYIDGSLVYNCILETDTYWPKMYAFVSLVAFFCLPLLVLMLVYWLIGRRLTRETIAMGTTTSWAAAAASNSTGTSQPAKVSRAEARQTKPWRVKRAASLKFKSILSSLQSTNCAGHYQSLREARFNQSKTISAKAADESGPALEELISSSTAPANQINANNQLGGAHFLVAPSAHIMEANEQTETLGKVASNPTNGQVEQSTSGNIIAPAGNSLNCNGPAERFALAASETSSSPSLKLGSNPDKHAVELPMNLAEGNNKITTTYSSIKGPGDRHRPTGLLARLAGRLLVSLRSAGNAEQYISGQLGIGEGGGEFTAGPSGPTIMAGRQTDLVVSSDSPQRLGAAPGHQSGQSITFLKGNSENVDVRATHSSAKTNDGSPRTTKKTTTLSRRSKFSLAKRFSISSSSASMQTNCTTLLSDGSSIGGGRSYQQQQQHKSGGRRSPRLLLRNQRSSLESQADGGGGHDCGLRSAKSGAKKSAHFDADCPLINAQAHGGGGGVDSKDASGDAYALPTYYASSVSGNSSSTPYTSKSPSPDSMFIAEPSDRQQAPSAARALLNFEPSGDKFDRCGKQKSNSFKVTDNEIDDDNSETNMHLIDDAGADTEAKFARNRNCDSMDLERRQQNCRRPERALNGSKPTTCSIGKQRGHHFHLGKSNNTKRAHHNEVYGGQNNNNNGGCNQQGTTSELLVIQDTSKKQQMDSRRQVVMMLAFVVACFFLLFFPYRVFTIWLILSTEDQVQSLGMETYYNLTYFSRILIYLHSAINPIAYNLISTKFRRAFMSILLCRGPGSRRHFTTEHQRMVYGNHRTMNSSQQRNNKSTTMR